MASIEIKSTDEECMYFPTIRSLQMGRDSNTHNMVLIFNQSFHIEFDGGQSKACKSIYNLIRKNLKDDKKTIYIDSRDGQGWIADVFAEGDYKPIESSEPDDPQTPNIDFEAVTDAINNASSEDDNNIVDGTAKEVVHEDATTENNDSSNTVDEVADYKEEVVKKFEDTNSEGSQNS